MPAPTDRPLPFVPGRDTRPGIVLLRLYEDGPTGPKTLSDRLLLPFPVVRDTLKQLRDAEFVETMNGGSRITRYGRRYLSFIIGQQLPERRVIAREFQPGGIAAHL